MGDEYLHELMEDPKKLAGFGFCSEEIYRDLLDCQRGRITEDSFNSKYLRQKAILCLDITGFTIAALKKGELNSLLRILDVHKVCGPVFHQFNARLIRAFADNFTVLFDDPNDALTAAIEIHKRIHAFNRSEPADKDSPQCCIGIGYGQVYAIGMDQAMGNEMNQASKLGEDIARGAETLVTEGAFEVLKERDDCTFRKQIHEEIPFPFYEVLLG
ncbi:adenylate/guanylate cyclase domain-containing protein [Thermodesulfobacteriota bacterium]